MAKISFPMILPFRGTQRKRAISTTNLEGARSGDGKSKGKTDSDGDEQLETVVKVRQVNACMQMSGRLFTALARERGHKLLAEHHDGISQSSSGRTKDLPPEKATTTSSADTIGTHRSAAGSLPQTTIGHASKPRACAYWVLLGMRHACEVLLPLLERPLTLPIGEARQAALARRWRPDGGKILRLIDVSATANQLNYKMRQFCLLPVHSNTLFGCSTARPVDLHDLTMRHTYHLSMLNSGCVCCVDMILGVCFILLLFYQGMDFVCLLMAVFQPHLQTMLTLPVCRFLLIRAEKHLTQTLEDMLETSRCVYIDFLREYVDWLIDEPAGFKLNKCALQRCLQYFFQVVGGFDGR